jgi:hypothetical protein
LEHNYYANYFSGVSGWYGVGYSYFCGSEGLTCGFVGIFDGLSFSAMIASRSWPKKLKECALYGTRKRVPFRSLSVHF